MNKLQMHVSNFKYVYPPVIDPLSPSCSKCKFMPDEVCGWGYDYLSECVFQIKPGTQYTLIPTYDEVQEKNGIYGRVGNGTWELYNKKHHRIEVVSYEDNWVELSDLLDNVEISEKSTWWSSDEELEDFYNSSWERGQYIAELSKAITKRQERGWQFDDYMKWSFKNDPCSVCGRVTSEFIIFGFRSHCKTAPIVKVCTYCIDDANHFCDRGNEISFGERLLQC